MEGRKEGGQAEGRGSDLRTTTTTTTIAPLTIYSRCVRKPRASKRATHTHTGSSLIPWHRFYHWHHAVRCDTDSTATAMAPATTTVRRKKRRRREMDDDDEEEEGGEDGESEEEKRKQ